MNREKRLKGCNMLQENPKASGQANLYRARLESIIDTPFTSN
jgi:hypothetical protein